MNRTTARLLLGERIEPVAWWPSVPLAYLALLPWRTVLAILSGAVLGATLAASCAAAEAARTARMTGAIADAALTRGADRVGREEPDRTYGIPPSPGGAVRASSVARSWTRAELEAVVRSAFPLEPERAVAVVDCESRFHVDAVGDQGAAVGLWQWHLATWTASARRALGYDPGDQRTDPEISTWVAAAKVAAEGWWAWTCAR